MKIINAVLLILLFILTLSACAQDPWKADQIRAQAEANATESAALQNALNQEQNRQQTAKAHELLMLQERLKYERNVALEAERRAAWTRFYFYGSLVGVACLVFAFFGMTRSTVTAYQNAVTGISMAIVETAQLRAKLIYLDDGRQFPALYEMSEKMITDITTGTTVATDQYHLGDPQQIAGAIANRHVSIVAKETRRSSSDTSVNVPLAQNPPIIEAKFSDVKEYLELLARTRGDDE